MTAKNANSFGDRRLLADVGRFAGLKADAYTSGTRGSAECLGGFRYLDSSIASGMHFKSFIVLILCAGLHSPALAEPIDRLIDDEVREQHDRLGQQWRPPCSDEAFVRRLYLDLAGTVPTPEQVREFLDDPSADKRNHLIDRLLQAPSFGVRLADMWDADLCDPNIQWSTVPLTDWLRRQFNNNRSWDTIVYELLTATGPQYENPAVTIWMAAAKNATISPQAATDLVGRCFMGIKLECAQCHNHPSADWSHRQYWGIAGFLGATELTSRWANLQDAPKRVDWDSVGGVYGVKDASAPSKRYQPPERALMLPPTFPDGRRAMVLPQQGRRAFADWLLDSEYPYLARTFVNRSWQGLFGCGLVSPVDDHRPDNPPLYAELQARLIAEFRDNGYDVKRLYRGICRSKTYQQQSSTHGDPRKLSGTNIRTVNANQMFDMLHTVLGDQAVANSRGIRGPRGSRRSFIRSFGDEASNGRPVRFSKSTPDFLRLLHSYQIEAGIQRKIDGYQSLWETPEAFIEELYLLTLSRRPSDREMKRMTEFVAGSDSAAEGYRGVLWALMNSAEFYLVP